MRPAIRRAISIAIGRYSFDGEGRRGRIASNPFVDRWTRWGAGLGRGMRLSSDMIEGEGRGDIVGLGRGGR